MATVNEKRNSKEEIDHVHTNEEVLKPTVDDNADRDYTGTARKTDPEEIKLVKKLDLMIMVCNLTETDEFCANMTSPVFASCTSSIMSTVMRLPKPA